MKFLEKVKNMFTEEVEEDDDVKVEKIKKEVTHVAIKSTYNDEDEDLTATSYEELPKRESKPIFFDDNDFNDLEINDKPKSVEKKIEPSREKENYSTRTKEAYISKSKEEKPVEEKKIFKPTPIISPVYGVLDKNYHKEDIVSRRDIEASKNNQESPIDAIRNKAYGTLEDELENTLFGSNSVLFKKAEDEDKNDVEVKEVDDNILTDLTDDISKELDELLVKKEKYVEKENKTEDDEDLLGFIDSTLYKDGDE